MPEQALALTLELLEPIKNHCALNGLRPKQRQMTAAPVERQKAGLLNEDVPGVWQRPNTDAAQQWSGVTRPGGFSVRNRG